MNVSSRKLIKSQNMIEVDSEKRFITDSERDFLISLFDNYFNGMHENNIISEQNLYSILVNLSRFYPNIIFDKDFYIFKDRPVNDLYFTYGFKITKSLDSSFNVIRYVLNYISEHYGFPNDKWDRPYKIQITEDTSITIIGV